MKIVYNPIENEFDYINNIAQVTADPASPNGEDAWVLREGSGAAIPDGTPIGLMLGLTYTGNAGTSYTYTPKYKTNETATLILLTSLRKITTVTGDYTILASDETIVCNSSSAFIVTLPATTIGMTFTIKNIGTGVVTVSGTIDGETSQTIYQYESMQIQCIADSTWGVI